MTLDGEEPQEPDVFSHKTRLGGNVVRVGIWPPTRTWEVCATRGATVCGGDGVHTETLKATQTSAKGCQEVHEMSKTERC